LGIFERGDEARQIAFHGVLGTQFARRNHGRSFPTKKFQRLVLGHPHLVFIVPSVIRFPDLESDGVFAA
jgi:hypothetical protein